MSSNNLAISISNLSKCYQVYGAPHDRLKQFIMPRLQGLVGKKTKQYFKEYWALRDVSFEVKKGETIGIIGRNGSGKSTLLQLICGTLTPSNGTVEVNGRVAALLELGSGFNPEFTGRENIYMYASVLGLTNEETNAQYDNIVDFADIGDYIDQPIKTYSSGMTVRLAFAVIAHVNADILIIDEALSVGDAFFVQKCMRFIRKFMEGGTVLFVSHDTGAILNLCIKAIWLEGGNLKASGQPKIITEKYLEQLYVAEQGAGVSRESAQVCQEDDMHVSSRDMRLDFINSTTLRNDIEVFSFSTDVESFGVGGAKITDVQLLDSNGHSLLWVVGGEHVRLLIRAESYKELHNVIVGFQVKDRLGQIVFADNTYLANIESPIILRENEQVRAEFDFNMPVLPLGDYSFSVALAEGTQERHIQHQWIHDAIVFRVHSTSVCHGLIGVPMKQIKLEKL